MHVTPTEDLDAPRHPLLSLLHEGVAEGVVHASDAVFGPPRFGFAAVPTRAISMALQMDPFPRLVTASAPPGYGKTVMLGKVHDELTSRGYTCLWLTLDDRDSDLSTLLYRLCASMVHAGIQGVPEMASASGHFPDRGATADAIVPLLANPHAPTALFIDNLGFCQDPALELFLERLVFHPQSHLHLLLSSTLDIPLDMARAKLEVGALELRAPHLSFDRASASSLLREAGLHAASEQQLDRIIAHTEGWPAAVRLLQVLTLGGVSEPSATPGQSAAVLDLEPVLERFDGDHRDIARVLTRRVLVGFDPALVQFMVEIALVREFNADLAAEMTGCHEAREWLNQLVARNVLIFPLDRNRRWFRFHTLLREFLLAENRENLTPARRNEVLERAAHWHLRHGDEVAAISIALDGGCTALAQQLLERVAHVVVGDHGQMSQLIQWVDRLMAAGAMPSPEVHAWFVWALCDSLQYERARQALDDLDRRAASDSTFHAIPGGAQQRMLFLRMLVNIWLDRLDMAHAQAETWLAQEIAADALTMSTVVSIAGIGEIDRGALAAARARMERARASIDRSDSAYGLGWVAILRACVEIGQARPNAADELLSGVRERIVRVIGADASVVATLDFVHARALLDQGREDAARKLAERSLGRAMHHGIMVSLEQGLIACVALWSGEADDGAGISTHMLDRVAHSYPPRGQCLLAAAKVRRLIQLGRLHDAQALAEVCGLNADCHLADGPQPMRERGDWMLAQLELQMAQRTSSAALARIDALIKTAQRDERHRDEIELLLLAADVHLRLGQPRPAQRSFSAAVGLAAPGNAMQPFELKKQLIGKLLSEAGSRAFGLASAAELPFLERLQALAGRTPAGAGDATSQTARDGNGNGSEEPTLREIELLELIGHGLTNDQVANQLNLSVSTVKWHLHNLYVKLGVRSRSAALARGRSMKLIGRS